MYKTLNILIGGEQKHQSIKTDGICTCLCSSMGCGGGYVPMIVQLERLGNIYGEDKGTGFAGNVWKKEGLCPSITTMQGGGREPMIVEEKNKNGGAEKKLK